MNNIDCTSQSSADYPVRAVRSTDSSPVDAQKSSDRSKVLLAAKELVKGCRRLSRKTDTFIHCLTIDPIEPPKSYRVYFDDDCSDKGIILSAEDILTKSCPEVKPASIDSLPEGTRVCCYRANQFKYLNTGTVRGTSDSSQSSTQHDCAFVQFDDGASCQVDLDRIRMLIPELSTSGLKTSLQPFLGKLDCFPKTVTNIEDTNSFNKSNKNKDSQPDESIPCMQIDEELANTSSLYSDISSPSPKEIRHSSSAVDVAEMENDEIANNSCLYSDISSPSPKEIRHSSSAVAEAEMENEEIANNSCLYSDISSPSPKEIRHHSSALAVPEIMTGLGTISSEDVIDLFQEFPYADTYIEADYSSDVQSSTTTSNQNHPPSAMYSVEKGCRITSHTGENYQSPGPRAKGSPTADDGLARQYSRKKFRTALEVIPVDYNERGRRTPEVKDKDQVQLAKSKKKLFHVTKANSQSGRSEQTLPKKLYLWQLSGPIKRRGRRQKYTFFQEIVRGKEKIQVGDYCFFRSRIEDKNRTIGRVEKFSKTRNGHRAVHFSYLYHPDEIPPNKINIQLKQEKRALFASNHFDKQKIAKIDCKCYVLTVDKYKSLRQLHEAKITPKDSPQSVNDNIALDHGNSNDNGIRDQNKVDENEYLSRDAGEDEEFFDESDENADSEEYDSDFDFDYSYYLAGTYDIEKKTIQVNPSI